MGQRSITPVLLLYDRVLCTHHTTESLLHTARNLTTALSSRWKYYDKDESTESCS